MRDRRILATLWSAAVVVSVVVTILSGLPAAFQNAIQFGPAFLSNPNTWWAVGGFVLWLVVMRWIWRRPEQTGVRKYLRTLKGQVPENVSLRVVRLSELLEDAKKVCRPSGWAVAIQKNYFEFAEEQLQHVFAGRIRDLFGAEAAETYCDAVKNAFKSTYYYRVRLDACYSRIEHLVLNEIEKEASNQNEHIPRPHHLPEIKAVALLPNQLPPHSSTS
jgi:hypothetical protein